MKLSWPGWFHWDIYLRLCVGLPYSMTNRTTICPSCIDFNSKSYIAACRMWVARETIQHTPSMWPYSYVHIWHWLGMVLCCGANYSTEQHFLMFTNHRTARLARPGHQCGKCTTLCQHVHPICTHHRLVQLAQHSCKICWAMECLSNSVAMFLAKFLKHSLFFKKFYCR